MFCEQGVLLYRATCKEIFKRAHSGQSVSLSLETFISFCAWKEQKSRAQVCLHALLFGLKLNKLYLYLHVAFAKQEKEKDLLFSRESSMFCNSKHLGSFHRRKLPVCMEDLYLC